MILIAIHAAASHNIAGPLYTKLAYDPQKDFAPLAHIGTAAYVLMIHPDVPAKTVAEFIRYAKANPGKMNYATAGMGSATHLSMAYFNGLAGIDLVQVPLKATGEAINEVISGRAHAVIAASIGALAFAKDSRIRLLGVTSPQRSKYLPELPTIAESGLPGYAFDSWFGLLGPAATPPAEATRINTAMARLLKDPVILERLDKQGHRAQSHEQCRLRQAAGGRLRTHGRCREGFGREDRISRKQEGEEGAQLSRARNAPSAARAGT